MHHELRVCPDADAVATAAAQYVAELANSAVADHDSFSVAVSGGHTPWAMFAELAQLDMPWSAVTIYQVDERVAPSGDPDRNLTSLRASLGSTVPDVRPMPVEGTDLDAGAADYAAGLPDRFDLVHLGLGPDGHTASLVPDDPVLEVNDRLVAPTGSIYQARRRLTLTYPALARASQLPWLVTGADKCDALARLLAGDTTIPAGRVVARASLVIADQEAAGPRS